MKTISKRGFTLIELLVVIAVVAVLAAVTIYVLNPSQLQSQGRDSNRLSDMTTLNQQVALYHEVQPAGSLGSSTVLYVSIPDPAATTTAGTNCASLGLPAAPSGYTYHCAASSTYKDNNGTGWIPVNFATASNGNLLPTLPVDPVNTTSSNEYYVYVTNGAQYEVLSNPESQKTITSNETSSYIQGNNLALESTFPGIGGGAITFTTSTLAVGNTPFGIAFDLHTNSIWVTNEVSNTVTKIDDTTHATSTYAVEGDPLGIAFDSHTNTLWVANEASDTVTQIQDATGNGQSYAMWLGPYGMTFDSSTNAVWVANTGLNGATQINDTTYATSTYRVGNYPLGITFDSHTNTIWVTNYDSNTVTRINDTTFTTSTYAVGANPYGIAFDSHTNTIWVATGGFVTKIDDTTYTTSTYAVQAQAVGIAFDSHTNSIWVSGSNTVTQINDTTYATSTYVMNSPVSIAFDSHNNSIWVVNQSVNAVTVLTPSQ